MTTWKQFNAIPNGTRVLNHGWDQCVALANLYHEDVIGGSFVQVGSAFQWWTEFSYHKTLTENYTKSSKPVAGAIFVARYGIYDAPNGHIGVVTKVHADGSFDTMEQNAGTWRYVGRYTRSKANVLGFLIPKDNPAVEKPATTNKKNRKNKNMIIVYYANAYPKAAAGKRARWAVAGPKYWLELESQASANNIAAQLGIGTAFTCKTDGAWNKFKRASTK